MRCRVYYECCVQPFLPLPFFSPLHLFFLSFLSLPLPPASTSDTLIETDDTIEVEGHVFHKPFVEKPISAEDHTVHIYFPSDYGGGCQQLFRKVWEYCFVLIITFGFLFVCLFVFIA